MEFETFKSWLDYALQRVEQIYYGRDWWQEMRYIPPDYINMEHYLQTNGERGFCYELYHYMRVAMHWHRNNKSHLYENHFNRIFLNAELSKRKILDAHRAFFEERGIERLDKNYFPDFLFHSPSDTDYQIVVMEVKSNPELQATDIISDLRKLRQFVAKYNYQYGIFLAINISPVIIQEEFIRHEIINFLQEIPNEDKERIFLMIKENSKSPVFEKKLSELIY
ncbi:hypothetical protein V0288_07925 [Pannus brasiliensis CCIBt3594]|uniref:Uncharacterized protein n=1 Tax=Pannus brasiliensis CCIBt3594 TaxID=1427578 RepID=A0AAW9QPN8_9CHRO